MKQIIISIWKNNGYPTLSTAEERYNFVKVKYIMAFLGALVLIYISYDLADIINENYPLHMRGIRIFQTISVAIMAVGVFGQPGRKIDSWSGDTKAEKLNEKISTFLSCFGFWFTICSYHLVPFAE